MEDEFKKTVDTAYEHEFREFVGQEPPSETGGMKRQSLETQ